MSNKKVSDTKGSDKGGSDKSAPQEGILGRAKHALNDMIYGTPKPAGHKAEKHAPAAKSEAPAKPKPTTKAEAQEKPHTAKKTDAAATPKPARTEATEKHKPTSKADAPAKKPASKAEGSEKHKPATKAETQDKHKSTKADAPTKSNHTKSEAAEKHKPTKTESQAKGSDNAHKKGDQSDKNDKSNDKKVEQKSKPKDAADSKSERFSFKNLTKLVVDTGNKIFDPEPEKIPNKVENADKLSPSERKAKNVEQWVDPKTGARHEYDKDGYLKEVRTKDHQRSRYEYDEKTHQLKNFTRVKTDEWTWHGRKSTGYAEAVDGKVVLEVNQKTGEVKTSSHEIIDQRDPKTKKAEKVEVKSEFIFHADGTKSALTRELNGRRISKDLLSADDKQTGKIFYQYADQAPGKPPNPEARVLAVQYGKDSRVNHIYEFKNSESVEKQKPAIREDIKYKTDGPINSEKHATYDLRSGKEVILSQVEKTVDNKKGQTKVHEEQYQKGKLATDHTVTFDEHAKAIDMRFKDLNAKVDLKVSFDINGKAHDITGDQKNLVDKSALLAIAEGQATRIKVQHKVTEVDAGEMLAYNGPTQPREGHKPTGVVAWKEAGSTEYLQGHAKDGVLFDTEGKKIGTVNDKGDVSLDGKQTFNILSDKQYSAVFHGVGTDTHPLDLCATQSLGDAKRQEGMNGYVAQDGSKILMVGGNMFSQSGEFIARMDETGHLQFARGTKPHQDAGTDVKSFLHNGWQFKGNENGNERRFFVDQSSNGSMFIPHLDEKTGQPKLDANGKPIAPIDCEIRLGMVIDKSTQKQLSNFIPPEVNQDKSFRNGAIISMDGQTKPLSDLTGASFNVQLLGTHDNARLIGVAAGPQKFQADGTPVPGVGGVINIQREIELEDQHLTRVTGDRDKAVSKENNEKLAATIMYAPVDATGTVARTGVDNYNEFMGNKQQTDALRTRQELAQKHHDETLAQLKALQDTGAIDANLLYKLQSGNAKVRESQLDPVDQQRYLNPQHKLENIICDPSEVNGFIRRPDLTHPGSTKGYDLRSSLIYKQGTDQCVGEIDAKTGTMKIYSATGRVETTRMNDPKLAGTIIHMEYPGQAGNKQSTDWLADGTGKLQSFNEMRKQAADQVTFVRSQMGNNPNAEGQAVIERTEERQARFNKTLDQILKNGVTTVPAGKDGNLNFDQNFQKVLEGPRKNVLSEKLQLEEKQPPPKRTELHQLRTHDDCSKTSGAMRLGAELLYCKNGKMFHAQNKDGKVIPVGECIGTLEPGYVVTLGNRRIALQNESQFLFQFKVDGEASEHRVFGTGAAHVDANGAFTGGGLVEADSLIKAGHESKREAINSMNDYFEEKPSGNYVADFLGWSTNKLLGDREKQMRYVGETIDNSNAGLSHQIDDMFQRGFAESASSNNRIDQNVTTVNRYMRDLNLSAGDMESLSVEGRSMQKQASEGVAMGLMSVVPGGVSLLATRLGVTSVAARTGMAFVAGGTISLNVRQTQKADAGKLFLSGGLEAMTMFAGAEGLKTFETLKAVNSARTLKAGETLSKEALELINNPATLKLMKNPAANAIVDLLGKPGGSAAVEGMVKIANAGVQTTGLTLASSIREGNFDQMAPGKIVENSTYMLAADLVAMSVHLPNPELIKLKPGGAGAAFREGVQSFSKEAINNFANSALTGRVQANEAELENIARERHIKKELISDELFEKYKNQTRINTFILNTAAEGMATTFVTNPMGHMMNRATSQYVKALERSSPSDVHPTEDVSVSPHVVPDLYIKGGSEIPDSLISTLIPLEESKIGYSRTLPDGSTEQWLHSGGQINEKGGKVTYVQDANGRETHVKYDDSGAVTRLDVSKGGHRETWIKDNDIWYVNSNGEKFSSKEQISVGPDGMITHTSADGTHAFKLDGSMHLSDGKGHEKTIAPHPDENLQRDYFDKMVDWHVEDPAVKNALRASANHLMERVIVNEKVELPVLNKDQKTEYKTIGNVERVEFARCLKEVSELLQDHPDAKLDKATRQKLAEECMWLAANPTYLSQGQHPTCAVAAVEVRQYMQHPSDVIRAVKELALTGEYKCPDGKVLKPFTAGGEFIFKPDECAMSHYEDSPIGRADGRRLMASQLWQSLAVSGHYANVDSFNGHTVGEGNIGFHNDFVSDMSTNPPRALHDQDGTHLRGEELVGAIKQLTGRSEDLVLLNKRYDGRDPNRHFEEMEDMHGKLWELYEKGEFPITYAVNTANPPFNIPGGEEHLVTIVGIKINVDPRDPRSLSEIIPPRGEIDPATGKQKLPDPKYVELVMDNQWEKREDNELRSVSLTDAYLASFSKEKATALRPGIADSAEQILALRSEHLGSDPNDRTTWSKEMLEKFRKASELEKEKMRANEKAREGHLEGNHESMEHTKEDEKPVDEHKSKEKKAEEAVEKESEKPPAPSEQKSAEDLIREKFAQANLLKLSPKELAELMGEMNKVLDKPSKKDGDDESVNLRSKKPPRSNGEDEPVNFRSSGSSNKDREKAKDEVHHEDLSTSAPKQPSDGIIHRATLGNRSDDLYRTNETTAVPGDEIQGRTNPNLTDHLYRTPKPENLEKHLSDHAELCLEDGKVKGLLSEFGFEHTLARAINELKEHSEKAGESPNLITAFIDLNNFKSVNTLYSMDMGDKALEVFGAEAKNILNKYGIKTKDSLGHFGGDEFGILIQNHPAHEQILKEIMSIRIGCKPISDDPFNQQKCEFVILTPDAPFKHTAYEVKTDPDTGEKKVTEKPAPIISATLGAVKWEHGMSAEDVLQTADKVMFEKKPEVKARLNSGEDAVINPFGDSKHKVTGQTDSAQLKRYMELSTKTEEFVARGMTRDAIQSLREKTFVERAQLYYDLLFKHRHTGIFDKEASKKRLDKFIKQAEDDGSSEKFTIIQLSIDNFKQVNDRMQSHAKGNQVLAELGKFLRSLDVNYVGSLGGTSPFLIVKDPARVKEIEKQVNEYFLKVSPKETGFERIASHEHVSGEEIAVGFSFGTIQWQDGMDTETLLNVAKAKTRDCEKQHILDGRHTDRTQDVPLPEGQKDQRVATADGAQTNAGAQSSKETPKVEKQPHPPKASSEDGTEPGQMSFAQNFDHGKKTKGNRPDVNAGNWTYSDVDRTKRTVTEGYMNRRMHMREVIAGEDKQLTILKEHPFLKQETMEQFADAISPMLGWERLQPGENRQEVLEQRRKIAQTAINSFLEQQNLPPITLETGPKADQQLNKEKGKAGYLNSTGIIMVRSEDLLSASNPEFIGILYHEILHAEQDVAMIKASALDIQRARLSATDSHQTGTASESIDAAKVRKHYMMLSGLHNLERDAADSVSPRKQAVADWIQRIVEDQHSKEWIQRREHLTLRTLVNQDVEYRRADWLRTSYLTGAGNGAQRRPLESIGQIDERVSRIEKMVDFDYSSPFREDVTDVLKSLNAKDPTARIEMYGYDPLQKAYDARDKTFTDLLTSDPKFAELVRDGKRREWLPLYDSHVKQLSAKAHEIDAQIKALDPASSDYQKRLDQLKTERPEYQDSPRTLKLLTRWELKGMIHGMNQRKWSPVYSSFDGNWNVALADHVLLIREDAKNQQARLKYTTTMRKGEEQEAYYVTNPMTERAKQKIIDLKANRDETE